ncbi:MAG: PhoPQ-activated protein PqaA family protein, partial [Phycisphaeraceae bacterium]|nr:PhoPQ-activated protein PqaA family protein [Phycisphaeraceae bacterium]
MNSGLLSTLCVLVFVVMGAFARVVAADVAAAEGRTELDVYVARPDDSYAWVKRDAGTFAGCEFAELTLTSQTWRGVPWKHRLFLVKPPVIQ